MAKEIKLILIKSEIIYDVMNECHIVSKNRSTGQNAEQVYNIQADTSEDSHKNKLLRSLAENVQELKTNLYSFLSAGTSSAQQVNNIQDTESGDDSNYVITLNVSKRFNDAYNQSLVELCHKWLKQRMLYDWYEAAKPDEAKRYFDLAQLTMVAIRNSFYLMPPTRPTHTLKFE